MTKKLFLAGRKTLLIAVLCFAVGGGAALRGQIVPTEPVDLLGPCEWNPELFPYPESDALEEETVTEIWRDRYHSTVAAVIETHMQGANAELVCSPKPVRMASDTLSLLAAQLEPWKSDNEALLGLEEKNLVEVLRRYLDSYMCALGERRLLLAERVASDKAQEEEGERFSRISEVVQVGIDELATIETEIIVAPEAQHDALTMLAGIERLEPIDGTLECLARASADLKNIWMIIGKESSCMAARTWDTQQSIFTPGQP